MKVVRRRRDGLSCARRLGDGFRLRLRSGWVSLFASQSACESRSQRYRKLSAKGRWMVRWRSWLMLKPNAPEPSL